MRGRFLVFFLVYSIAYANPGNLVLTALSYMERPYQFGANELYRLDCSAFVQRVFMANGIRMPRTTEEQYKVGKVVSLAELREGDLLFFSTYKKGPSHVGIYIGNGKMVHASESTGVTVSRIDEPYWRGRFLLAKRVLPQTQPQAPVHTRDEIADLIHILANR